MAVITCIPDKNIEPRGNKTPLLPHRHSYEPSRDPTLPRSNQIDAMMFDLMSQPE